MTAEPHAADSRAGWTEAQIDEIYRREAAALCAYAVGLLRTLHDAEDCVQRAFLKLCGQPPALEAGLSTTEEVRRWLFRVTFNEAMHIRRQQGVHQRAVVKWEQLVASRQPGDLNPLNQLLSRDQQQQIREAIKTLPPVQQNVVHAKMNEQLTFAEIAASRGIPLGTVLTRMRLAMNKLRPILGQTGETDDAP